MNCYIFKGANIDWKYSISMNYLNKTSWIFGILINATRVQYVVNFNTQNYVLNRSKGQMCYCMCGIQTMMCMAVFDQ